MRWPNLFIVGAPRAGTTSLHEYLHQIPEIYMSAIKEPNYFAIDNCYSRYLQIILKDENSYLKLFENENSKRYIGESSTIYLSNKNTPKRIHLKSPKAKIIIILRDPIERAFSHYFHHFEMDFKSIQKTFDDQIKLELERGTNLDEFDIRLEFGLYFQDVKMYVDEFGENNVKILIFEEFVKNVEDAIKDICEFLNIQSNTTSLMKKIHNASITPRGKISTELLHSRTLSKIVGNLLPISSKKYFREKLIVRDRKNQKMSTETRISLKNYYQEDVNQMKHFLGRNLPWPNF